MATIVADMAHPFTVTCANDLQAERIPSEDDYAPKSIVSKHIGEELFGFERAVSYRRLSVDLRKETPKIPPLRAATWNVAAVNNNPFEYWVTNPDPAYNNLMSGVQEFIENPGSDVSINEIFTDGMFADLCEEMKSQGIQGLSELEVFWKNDYSQRTAVKGFLKDKSIGIKRLASMPDRITNTINLHDGSICKRPTVINSYDGVSFSTIDGWWRAWKEFMFHTTVQTSTGDADNPKPPEIVCKLLGPILRSKYPAVSIEEQAISVALQLLCLALLDAIFVYMLNTVEPQWEQVRRDMCSALIDNKTTIVCSILARSYTDMHVIFIQEAAAMFALVAQADPSLQAQFALLLPHDLDGKRNQNSLILVDRGRFRPETCVDVTHHVLDGLGGTWVAPGDLIAVSIEDYGGTRWLLSSFHGDSNGLSTEPVVRAIDEAARGMFPDHLLVVGIDANTYSAAPDAFHQSVDGFAASLAEQGMVSTWGDAPDPAVRTTCTARTFLQTQLNKATPMERRSSLSHQNLKDWIVCYDAQVCRVVIV